jgi:hypothetical protein
MKEKDLEKQKEVLKDTNAVKQKVRDILENDEKIKEIMAIKSEEIENWKKRRPQQRSSL